MRGSLAVTRDVACRPLASRVGVVPVRQVQAGGHALGTRQTGWGTNVALVLGVVTWTMEKYKTFLLLYIVIETTCYTFMKNYFYLFTVLYKVMLISFIYDSW